MSEKTHTLHNIDISANYKDHVFYLMLSDFKGAMAYWLVAQNTKCHFNINIPVKAFTEYLEFVYFAKKDKVITLTYEGLENAISENVLLAIPEIRALNLPEKHFLDIAALARNVFYMICRNSITQPLS